MELTKETVDYIDEHSRETIELLKTLAKIPAPSHHEEKRAEFCRNWLEAQGAEGVYIDSVLNVICPFGDVKNGKLSVFMAHSDVVFPDTEEFDLVTDGNNIRCPGILDDTVNVTALLMTAKYLTEKKLIPDGRGILIVINSCEEGLGNLKGSRRIVDDFGERIDEFFSFDSWNCHGVLRAVGSERYRVEICTEGGHSYDNFGNRNAIVCMSSLISELYEIVLPEKGKTTYNVGTISGGTSVNTIAQYAEMLYEFRSDDRDSLAYMRERFMDTVDKYRRKGINVAVIRVGERPCSGDVDEKREEELARRVNAAAMKHFGRETTFYPGSTDCNIPLSRGIPSVCAGFFFGDGMHTREEYLDTTSIIPGLKAVAELILYRFLKAE